MKNMMVLYILLLLFIFSCGQQENSSGKTPLKGRVTMGDVYRDFPRFRQVGEDFTPDTTVIRRLKETDTPFTVKVFLGTWCSDSREHVPPFDRLLKAAGNPMFTVEYYALDRKKEDGLGVAGKFEITYVPTFVILKEGREVGRIVETPQVSIGDDLLSILGGGE